MGAEVLSRPFFAVVPLGCSARQVAVQCISEVGTQITAVLLLHAQTIFKHHRS